MELQTTHQPPGGHEPEVGLSDLARLADALVEQVAEARRQYGELRAELDAVDGVDAGAGGATPDREPESDRDIRQHQREQGRLLALNYAVEGRSADEARTELRESFDIKEADAIVDSVFAPDSEPERPRRFRRFRRRT